MKVLFVYPHTLGHGDIPLALTVLSAVLRKAGHQVKVFDCSFYANSEYMLSKKELYGMVKPSPKPFFEAPAQKGLSELRDDLVQVMGTYRPGLVGVTATTAIYPLGLQCARIAKQADPQVKIIFGGIHPTLCPEEVIAEDGVDMLCIGEGEGALVDLCDALDNNRPISRIKNLWIKDPENSVEIIRNETRPFIDMNTLPVPDYQDFAEYNLYRPFDGNIYKMMHVEMSRGCVFNCSYCANHVLRQTLKSCGQYHRRQDPDIAVKHLKVLKEKYRFNFVRIWDEDFTGHPMAYIRRFGELYKEEVGLPFLIYADTRSINEEKVDYLKEMGCVTMAIGIESGSFWLRKYVLHRNITNEEIIKKFIIAKKSGIRISAYNMIGLPFETREMVFETIRLNRQVDVATSTVGAFKPFPKTHLTELAEQFGLIKRKPDFLSLDSEMRTPYMDEKEIDGLVRTFIFYTKLPEEMFPLLEKCEKDKKFAEQTLPTLKFNQ